MKRLSLVLTLCFALLVGGQICSAEIAQDRIGIGGVGFGSSMEYVNSIYGEPTNVDYGAVDWGGQRVRAIKAKYGGRYTVVFVGNEQSAVDIISTSTSFATPDGVTVGMSADELSGIYGDADSVRTAYGGTLYGYIGKLDSGDYSMLEFDVRDGVITEIEIHIKH